MANEVTVRATLQINKDHESYDSRPGGFSATKENVGGPTPGHVLVGVGGTDIDLSQLTVPGFCRLQNKDEENYVEYGIKEPSSGFFYPLGELGPGETYVLKLSRNIRQEYTGTGTGTSAPTNTLHMKANTSACKVLVEAFER